MRLASIATGSLLLLGVAACSSNFAGTTATGGTPSGTTSSASRASSQMPQTQNSLPVGASVNAPVATTTGAISKTSSP